MDIKTFESRLRSKISDPTTLRPFICDGSPLNCQAFIVGLNAATTMKANWWEFWDGSGFDKENWYQQYRAERRGQKTRMGHLKKEVSNTRERIGRVVASALEGEPPLHCLETNFF